mmetsp:Transcript_27495/g.55452  ORF Transcript_27495/g.55452 Transcript_27495/m.55452 type:complete len:170 (+) Transcript_27495:291-800(+)
MYTDRIPAQPSYHVQREYQKLVDTYIPNTSVAQAAKPSAYAPASTFHAFIRIRLFNFKYLILSRSAASSHFIRRNSASVTIGWARLSTHGGYSLRARDTGASLFFMKFRPGIGVPGFIAAALVVAWRGRAVPAAFLAEKREEVPVGRERRRRTEQLILLGRFDDSILRF